MECRIGGADLNPYLAFAALIASGLAGVDERLELQRPFEGDAYAGAKLTEIPKTLREAITALEKSKMLREALGNDMVEHYLHTARWEQFEYDRPHHRLGAAPRLRAVLNYLTFKNSEVIMADTVKLISPIDGSSMPNARDLRCCPRCGRCQLPRCTGKMGADLL